MSESDTVIAGRYRLLRQIGTGGMGVVWRPTTNAWAETSPSSGSTRGGSWTRPRPRWRRSGRCARRASRPACTTPTPSRSSTSWSTRGSRAWSCSTSRRSASPSWPPGRIRSRPPRSRGSVPRWPRRWPRPTRWHRPPRRQAGQRAGRPGRRREDQRLRDRPRDGRRVPDDHRPGHRHPGLPGPRGGQGRASTPASDVFSLGSTLYTALEGRTPFGTHENSMALLHRVASGEIEPPRRSGAVTPVVSRMLAVRPQDRPTMAEVESLLRAAATQPEDPTVAPHGGDDVDAVPAVAGEPGDDLLWAFRDEPPTEPAAVAADAPPRRRRGRLLVALALVVAAAALVLGIVAQREQDPVPASPQRSASVRPPMASSAPAPSTTAAPASPSPTPTPTPTRRPAPTRARGRPSPDAATRPGGAHRRGAARGGARLLRAAPRRPRRRMGAPRAALPAHHGAEPGVLRLLLGGRRPGAGVRLTASAPGSVTATLTYHYADGRVFVERTAYRLVRDDGELKIDRSSVLSSVQR